MTIDSLVDTSPTRLLDAEGYGSGSWSPDGSEIALPRTEDRTLMRVDGDGGTPSAVPDFGDGVYSLAWGTR